MSIKERMKKKIKMRRQSKKLEQAQSMSKVHSDNYLNMDLDNLQVTEESEDDEPYKQINIFNETHSDDSSEEEKHTMTMNSSMIKKSIVTDKISMSSMNAFEVPKKIADTPPEDTSY